MIFTIKCSCFEMPVKQPVKMDINTQTESYLPSLDPGQ